MLSTNYNHGLYKQYFHQRIHSLSFWEHHRIIYMYITGWFSWWICHLLSMFCDFQFDKEWVHLPSNTKHLFSIYANKCFFDPQQQNWQACLSNITVVVTLGEKPNQGGRHTPQNTPWEWNLGYKICLESQYTLWVICQCCHVFKIPRIPPLTQTSEKFHAML